MKTGMNESEILNERFVIYVTELRKKYRKEKESDYIKKCEELFNEMSKKLTDDFETQNYEEWTEE
jgi:hypothetical protein